MLGPPATGAGVGVAPRTVLVCRMIPLGPVMRSRLGLAWRIRLMRRLWYPRGYRILHLSHFLHAKRGSPPVGWRRGGLMGSVGPSRTGVTRRRRPVGSAGADPHQVAHRVRAGGAG